MTRKPACNMSLRKERLAIAAINTVVRIKVNEYFGVLKSAQMPETKERPFRDSTVPVFVCHGVNAGEGHQDTIVRDLRFSIPDCRL
jgi:hypothetical protein